jgi:hypothetical protein
VNDGYEIRPFRPEDEDSLLETYNRVFAAEGTPPRTREEWRWAFERNPAGRRIFVALREGRVVAQYAAMPVRMRCEGRQVTALHIVDSMVHPEHRSGAQQPGLFVATARAFSEAYGGPERELLHFGWPVERAWRVGRRMLDYEIVRVQNAMVAEASSLARASALPDGVRAVERFGPEFDALGERCAADVAACGLRGAAFLAWRYAEHPRRRYRSLAAGAPGSPEGLAVWRRAQFGGTEAACLVEWLVPLGADDAARALLAAVAAEVRAAGLDTLALWCPEWSPWCADFQERGFRVQPTDYLTTALSWSRRHDLLWLRDHWWYQLGDTDIL